MPDEPPPAGFPVIASVAPLAAAAVIWGLTGSVFALVFAGLSPVMAVASVLDGRRSRRRARRRGEAHYAASLALLRAVATEQQAELCAERWQRTPSAASILAVREHAAYWPSDGMTQVSVGSGSIDGGLRLDGADTTPEHRALSLEVATLTGAPIVVDATHGIGIVGSVALTRALARSLVIQLCTALPPTRCGFGAPTVGWEWSSAVPHRESAERARELVVWEHGECHVAGAGERLLIAVATSVTALPPGCDTIVRVHAPDRAEIVRSAAQPRGLSFRPELISTAEAGRFAAVLRRQALSSGLLGTHPALAATVAFSSLVQGAGEQALPGLACTIGRGEHGEVCVDLVRDGPHAVVGGTTGSGKSELLVTWILAMAATRSVLQVNFLLVDFKGGAAFGPLVALPHCVGLVTDLDAGEATRALASLSAEIHRRERILRDAEARAIDDPRVASALPRLVIVVDEFATMLDAFGDLHALFVDIAARGRSLGVHLILCTQRPAGVARDALLANCSLRVSLRVNNRADSLAVLGTDAAAALSPATPGRAFVDTGDGAVSLCQIATSNDGDLDTIIGAHSDHAPPRRPWLQPLPTQLTAALMAQLIGTKPAAEVPSAALTLGLLDEPEYQRYRVAAFDPSVDGHLLVVGAARSGKSSALALIETAARAAHVEVESVGADVERAWDLLESAERRSAAQCGDSTAAEVTKRASSRPLLLLFDDFDSVLARWEPEHRLGALDLLTAVLRDGAAAGITCVIAVQRVNNGLHVLPTLCPSRLLLRVSHREDFLAAGGLPERFDPALPPGGGVWQDRRIQLLQCPAAADRTGTAASVAPAAAFSLDGTLARSIIVVAGAPARCAERLRRSAGGALHGVNEVIEIGGVGAGPEHLEMGRRPAATVFVGDAEAWQSEWALLHAMRPQATMIFDGCSLVDFRQISRRRQLPPPLAPSRGHVWVMESAGNVRRGVLPKSTNSSDTQLANTEIDTHRRKY